MGKLSPLKVYFILPVIYRPIKIKLYYMYTYLNQSISTPCFLRLANRCLVLSRYLTNFKLYYSWDDPNKPVKRCLRPKGSLNSVLSKYFRLSLHLVILYKRRCFFVYINVLICLQISIRKTKDIIYLSRRPRPAVRENKLCSQCYNNNEL